jgi:organic radical activating enzyme
MTFKSVDEYLNSNFLKNLQSHLLTQNELPAECRACASVEDKNGLSVRQLKQKFFDNQYLTKTDIKELDIFPSNTCNLACVMCSPKFSSAYAAEAKQLEIIDQIYNFDITTIISDSVDSLNSIEYATIAGGEFFYLKHRRLLLEKLFNKNKNIQLKITSNGTVYDDKNLDLLKQFENLVLRFSLDGVEDNYELIRYPANWEEVKNNILQYKSNLPNARIETVMVVQPLGVFSLFEWMDFANQHEFETHWNPVYGNLFSWMILTEEEKTVVSDWLLTELPKHQLNTKQKVFVLNLSKNMLKKEPFLSESRNDTLQRLSSLCKIRNLDLSKVCTILEPWPNLLDDFLLRVKQY